MMSDASTILTNTADKKRLNPYFLNHYLNWGQSQKRLKSIALRAIGQSNISATRLRTFLVPVPPLEEQIEIGSHIDTISEKLISHKGKKELLEELFRALLHKLIIGQIRAKKD